MDKYRLTKGPGKGVFKLPNLHCSPQHTTPSKWRLGSLKTPFAGPFVKRYLIHYSFYYLGKRKKKTTKQLGPRRGLEFCFEPPKVVWPRRRLEFCFGPPKAVRPRRGLEFCFEPPNLSTLLSPPGGSNRDPVRPPQGLEPCF